MVEGPENRRGRSSPLAAWLQLLHFGPSVFTTVLFAAYIGIAAGGWPDTGRLLLLLAAQLATQFSISLHNDVADYHLDAISKPGKPLPAGTIDFDIARWLGWGMAWLALALALRLGPSVLLLNGIGLAAGLIYDYGLKRTALSWLPFAIGFGVLPLWAWAGLGISIPPQVYWSVPLIAVLVLALHLADTLPDLETDRAAGLRGLAHRLGSRGALLLCWAALGAGILLAAVLGIFFSTHVLLWVVLAGGLALLGMAMLIYRGQGQAVLRRMARLIELASMLVALGWVAATNL